MSKTNEEIKDCRCPHCGNDKLFSRWTELEYDDGCDEPNTSNKLIGVEYVKCLKCENIL